MTVRIDPEFKALIPPLQPEERAQLEANIAAEGVRDPLVAWQGVLIDGHNRHEIATRLGKPYQVIERTFDSRDDAVLWVIYNQFGRRNLTTATRAELGMRIEPILAAQAKARQVAALKRGEEKPVRLNSAERELTADRNHHAESERRTATQAAEAAGLKRDTYHKAKTVLTSAPAPIVEAFRAGEISTNQAYQHVKREIRHEQMKDAVAKQAATAPTGAPTVTCASAVEWLGTITPGSVDLLVTDPPYSTDVADIQSFAQGWLPIALQTLKPTGRAYVCVGAYPQELMAYMSVAMPAQVLVWTYRNTIGPSPTHTYKQNWQAVLYYAGKDAAPLDCPRMVEQFSVQDINAPDARLGDRFHAWQKPLELASRFVLHGSKPGDLVIDPFTGTGTFLLAAASAGRVAMGGDESSSMIDLAVERGCRRV